MMMNMEGIQNRDISGTWCKTSMQSCKHVGNYTENRAVLLQHHALTSLVSGHLGLQVLGGDVELGLLVHGRPRFTFPAAAVTAAAEATAEITTRGQAAEDEQGLWDEEPREKK